MTAFKIEQNKQRYSIEEKELLWATASRVNNMEKANCKQKNAIWMMWPDAFLLTFSHVSQPVLSNMLSFRSIWNVGESPVTVCWKTENYYHLCKTQKIHVSPSNFMDSIKKLKILKRLHIQKCW